MKTRCLIARYSINRRDIREIALEKLDLSSFKDILDLGCAYGFFTERLAGRLKSSMGGLHQLSGRGM